MEASSLRLLNELISDIVMMLNFLEMHRLQHFVAGLNGLEIYVYINRSFRSIYIYIYILSFRYLKPRTCSTKSFHILLLHTTSELTIVKTSIAFLAYA